MWWFVIFSIASIMLIDGEWSMVIIAYHIPILRVFILLQYYIYDLQIDGIFYVCTRVTGHNIYYLLNLLY